MSSISKAKCLVRGSINADEYFHVKAIAKPGQTISSSNFQTAPGGKGANQAVAVAKAGGSVDFVGAVGPSGQWLVDVLISHGVGVGRMARVQEPTGRALIQVAEDGENSIVLHHGANHAELPPPNPSDFTGVTHLLLQNEIPMKSTIEYLNMAHSQGISSVMNPSPIPSKEQIAAFPWSRLSWLIVNEGEASTLLDTLDPARSYIPKGEIFPFHWPQSLSGAIGSAYTAASRLMVQPVFNSKVNIVCTLGGLGVMALLPTSLDYIYLPAAKLQAPVLDTTGAGDCFAGYFVAGLMELYDKEAESTIPAASRALVKADVEKILQQCVQAAGLCVQKSGTIDSIPDVKDVYSALG